MADKIVFKHDQQQAIDHQGDLVLTASAGTGKTTILVEKFANTLIREIESRNPGAALSSMVAITFTDMAAAELKGRIRERLFEEILSSQNSEKKRQDLNRAIRDLDGAYIGTIHSFCKRILIENFLEAEVNPGFAILDENDADELRSQAAEMAIFKALSPESEILSPLVASVGITRFKSEIINLEAKLRSDGYENFRPEQLIADFRAHCPEALPTINKALDLLLEVQKGFHLFNAGSATDTTLKSEECINQGLDVLKDVKDSYDSFYDTPLPDILSSTKISPLPRNKDLAYIKDISHEFRQLIGKEPSLDFTLSDLANLNGSLPLMQLILEIVRDYQEIYSREKSKLDSYDFDDLLLKTRNLLKSNDAVLKLYHQKFKHLFVDEFQDVNAVQMEIVQLLRGFGDDTESRSLFLVGDGKQSIYKFRSADVMRFEAFVDSIEEAGGTKLQLKSNFRSTPVLIDIFNNLFSRMFEKEQTNSYQTCYQDLEAGLGETSSEKTSLDIIEMSKPEERYEAQKIAWKIRELLKDPEEKIHPGDIAILLRTTSRLGDLETEFKRANIPYRVIGGKGFYLQREIWDIAVYLKSLWFPEDNYATAALLRSPLCGLSDQTLYELSRKRVLKSLELFDDTNAQFIANDAEKARFLTIARLIQKHRAALDTISTADIIAQLLQTSGYEAFLLATVGGDQSAANVRKLIELARNFESKGVDSGLEFTLDLFSRLFTDTDEQQATLAGDDLGSVKILTVHKSKGLQFPIVFLPFTHSSLRNTTELIIYESKFGPGIRYYNPETGKAEASTYYNMVKKVKNLQDEAEMLRLFYVAATRAKKRLFITSKEKSLKGSWKNRIDNLGLREKGFEGIYGIRLYSDEEIQEIPGADMPLIQRLGSLEKRKNGSVENFLTQCGRAVQLATRKINCSVWELINLVYPREDLPEYVAEMIIGNQENQSDDADAPVAATEAGTAIHELLEHYDFQKSIEDNRLEEQLQKTPLSEDQRNDAKVFLENWFGTDVAGKLSTATTLRRETPFSLQLKRGNVVITVNGIIDLVAEFPDGSFWLLDYKYARAKDSLEYQLQMQLYSMVLKKAMGRLPDKCYLAYIKDAENRAVETSEASLSKAEEMIWEKVNPEEENDEGKIQIELF